MWKMSLIFRKYGLLAVGWQTAAVFPKQDVFSCLSVSDTQKKIDNKCDILSKRQKSIWINQ